MMYASKQDMMHFDYDVSLLSTVIIRILFTEQYFMVILKYSITGQIYLLFSILLLKNESLFLICSYIR